MGLDDHLDWLPALVALACVLWALYGTALSNPISLAIASTALSSCLAIYLHSHHKRRSRFLPARRIGQAIPDSNKNDTAIEQVSTKNDSLTQASAHQHIEQQQHQAGYTGKEADVVKAQLTNNYNNHKNTPQELSMDDTTTTKTSSSSSSGAPPLVVVEPQQKQNKSLPDQWDHVVVGGESFFVLRMKWHTMGWTQIRQSHGETSSIFRGKKHKHDVTFTPIRCVLTKVLSSFTLSKFELGNPFLSK